MAVPDGLVYIYFMYSPVCSIPINIQNSNRRETPSSPLENSTNQGSVGQQRRHRKEPEATAAKYIVVERNQLRLLLRQGTLSRVIKVNVATFVELTEATKRK